MDVRSVCLKIRGVDRMPSELLCSILDSAAGFRRTRDCIVFPRYFGEASLRDDFVDIIEKQFSLGLTFDGFWFPTSGEGLVNLSADSWKRLAETGFSWIRLAFHGAGEEHDLFLERPGSWNTLVRTAELAGEHGMDWYPVIFLNRHNAHRYRDIRWAVENTGSPSLPAGWMVPNWQNRPEFDRNRVSINQISHLTGNKSIWKSEANIIEMIRRDKVLAESPVFDPDSGIFYLGCLPDGRVYYAGGCHGEPFTEHMEKMIIGSFRETQDISVFIRRAQNNPPPQVKALAGVTFRELADLLGDPESPLVYRVQDLVVNKWGSQYLKGLDLPGA